jgi:hypothetical protein
MNLMRKLGWMLLLATTGLASTSAPSGDEPGDTPGGPSAGPAPQPGSGAPQQAPVQEEPPLAWPWWADEEDEFEGEGWTFWGR